MGAGHAALGPEDICCLNEPSDSAVVGAPTGIAARLVRHVHQDCACSACYANLIRALYELDQSGNPIQQQIEIGQGWKQKHFDGFGIGNCCSGAEHCIPGCPPTAERIVQDLND